MKKFNYRMQNLLNLKCKLEEQAKNNYTTAKAELNRQEEKKEQLIKRKEEYEASLKESMCGKLLLTDMRRYESAVTTVKSFIILQNEEIKKAEKKVDQAMECLKQAMVDRKMHERLRETAFEEYKRQSRAEEDKEVDELISFQHSSGIGTHS